MPPFRPVSGPEAGPTAVGILVPPGRRTLVVLRPRALEFDLLLVRRGDDGLPTTRFHEAGRPEASLLATNLGKALVVGTGTAQVEPAPDGRAWLRAEIGPFALIACARQAGEAYRPLVFGSVAEARQAAAALEAVLRPGADADCQLYFNTQHFTR